MKKQWYHFYLDEVFVETLSLSEDKALEHLRALAKKAVRQVNMTRHSDGSETMIAKATKQQKGTTEQ